MRSRTRRTKAKTKRRKTRKANSPKRKRCRSPRLKATRARAWSTKTRERRAVLCWASCCVFCCSQCALFLSEERYEDKARMEPMELPEDLKLDGEEDKGTDEKEDE